MRTKEKLLEAFDRIYNRIPRIVEVQRKWIKEHFFDMNKGMMRTILIVKKTSLGPMVGFRRDCRMRSRYVNDEYFGHPALNTLGHDTGYASTLDVKKKNLRYSRHLG